MKKILLPIEETQRSLKALHYVKTHYGPEDAELVLLMIDEKLGYSVRSEAEAAAVKELDEKLALIATSLEGYKVTLLSAVGKAGIRITRAARETGADLIIMTKSSKEDMLSSIGATAEYVINNAPCDVVIVSEQINRRNEYRGLVYRTAKGTVTLRGQLGDKQSECLLPSVNQDCIYHINMIVGKVRFFHTAYNPETRNWDQPPLPGQEVTLDIAAGESRNILVKADSNDGKADRIRIVNRDMKREAVFDFRITAAPKEVVQEPAPEPDYSVKPNFENRATQEVPKIPVDFEAPEVPTFLAEHAPAEKPFEPSEDVKEAISEFEALEKAVAEAEKADDKGSFFSADINEKKF
ncbi:MAG: universal stress protein [Clostridiales bacterium]|nr:universal stress protein [Clostridiales bacterium]